MLKYGTCCNGMYVSPCPSNAIWIYQITHLREILEGSRIPTSPLNYIKGIAEFAPHWSVVLGKVMYAACGVICECHSLWICCIHVWSVAFWATAGTVTFWRFSAKNKWLVAIPLENPSPAYYLLFTCTFYSDLAASQMQSKKRRNMWSSGTFPDTPVKFEGVEGEGRWGGHNVLPLRRELP